MLRSRRKFRGDFAASFGGQLFINAGGSLLLKSPMIAHTLTASLGAMTLAKVIDWTVVLAYARR